MPQFKTVLFPVLAAVLAGATVQSSHAATTGLTRMPAELETRYALSALPPALRDAATVYRLDPAKGYEVARQGGNGLTCLVERTVWEWGELRDDVFVPLCYDAAGTGAHLRVIIDTAALRAQGLDGPAIKAEIKRRYAARTYTAPTKPGLSYMIAPVMRALGPPDMKMHTMAMPHLMFYAPGLVNTDIAAKPDLADLASLRFPFVDRQGNAEQTYMIQLLGETEKAKVLVDEKELVQALCAYNEVLCLSNSPHSH